MGKGYRKPGIGARILAFFLKIVPKVGPFKAVSFKIPTTKTENMYIASVNDTVEDYAQLLHQVNGHDLTLRNLDFDTGKESKAGEYTLADKTYAHLVDDLCKKSDNPVPPELKANIAQFFADAKVPSSKKEAQDWNKLQDDLTKLRQAPIPGDKAPDVTK